MGKGASSRGLFETKEEVSAQLLSLPQSLLNLEALGRLRRRAERYGERLDNDPDEARYGCFLPDLTGLARRLSEPAPRSAR